MTNTTTALIPLLSGMPRLVMTPSPTLRSAMLLCLFALTMVPVSAQVIPMTGQAGAAPADTVVVASPDTPAEREMPDEADAVLLRTGEWLVGGVQIQPSADRPRYALVDGARVELSQIDAYRVGGSHYVVLTHYPRDFPRVLLLVERGPVELFREPRQTSGADFYRHEGGRIQLLTGTNLRADIGGHPEALAHLRRERVVAHTGTAAFLVGLGLVASGAAIQLDYIEAPLSGVIVAGMGVGVAALVNSVVPGVRHQARLAAVRAYNQ